MSKRIAIFILFATLTQARTPLPDVAFAVAFEQDAAGNLYVAGTTAADPSQPFAAKLTPDGSQLLYLVNLPAQGQARAVFVDESGTAYVAGSDGARHPYVAKIGPHGELVYSTTLTQAPGTAVDLAVNAAGEIYVTGSISGDFAKLDPSANLLWVQRTIGGAAVALDQDGNVYTAGSRFGNSDPQVTPGAFQSTHNIRPCGGTGFVGFACSYQHLAKLRPDGTLVYATFLTGDYGASPSAIVVDQSSNLYVAGNTNSRDYPVTEGVLGATYQATDPPRGPCIAVHGCIYPPPSAGFLSKLNADGSLAFSTYLNGTRSDLITGLRLHDGTPYVAAYATSADFPGMNGNVPQACLPQFLLLPVSSDGQSSGDAYLLDVPPTTFAINHDGQAAILTTAGDLVQFDPSAPAEPTACLTDTSAYHHLDSVAPGQLVSLFRRDLAPQTEAADYPNGPALPSSLAGIQVTFDGMPAPLLYASPDQINAVVPYEIAGRDHVTMEAPHVTRTFGVVPRLPAAFLQSYVPDSSGACLEFFNVVVTAVPLARNQDGSINTCETPALPDSVVSLYINGGGVPTTPTPSGSIATEATPVDLPVEVTYAKDQTLEVVSLSLEPGSVTSIWRLDIRVPHFSQKTLMSYVAVTLDGHLLLDPNLMVWVDPAP